MTFTLQAVYQGGVLKLAQPLPFGEGEHVEVVVTQPHFSPTSDDASERRIREAKTLEEWVAAANAAPDENEDYDLPAALNANRRLSGDFRPLFPGQ